MSFNGGGASPNDAILFGFRRTMRSSSALAERC